MAKSIVSKWLEEDKLLLIKGWKRNGLKDEEIARNIGISIRTFERWKADNEVLSQAVKTSKQQANFMVENKLFKKAMDGNTTAIIFWLKNNWREKYNDSTLSADEILMTKARTQKLKTDVKISERKLKLLDQGQDEVADKLDKFLSKLDDSLEDTTVGDGDGNRKPVQP